MFDVDRFVADCRVAQLEDSTHKSVREVVTRAVSEPGAVLKGLGEPQRSGVQKIGGIKSTDAWVLSHAKCDFADQTLGEPIKAHFPF